MQSLMSIWGILFTLNKLYIVASNQNRLDEAILTDDTMYSLIEN